MALRLYNSLTKKEEEFVPMSSDNVTIYTCGPTVYGRPHIGNYSSFLMADLLARWLEVSGFTVTHAKNITDVGHLVADQDEGEDKIQKQAKEEKLDPLAIAKKYTEQYLADEHLLNMREPQYRPKATEYIKQMLHITKQLLANGHAYETDDGVYFSVTTFPEYGKLSGNKLESLDAGNRIDVNEHKKHPADFALWKKTIGSNAHHLLRWSFDTGERTVTEGDDASSGFPGWHIECSAMARACLGERIDIHTGGEDNIFPHHECEIAQSECSGPTPFANFWLHKRRIEIALDGQESLKMSKSLGNILTLTDLEEKGFSPLDVRYYLLSVHYRTNLKFSWKGLEDAKKARKKIVDWIREVQSVTPDDSVSSQSIKESLDHFTEMMDEDLNTSAALADIFSLMNTFYAHQPVSSADKKSYLEFIDLIQKTFGCFDVTQEEVPADVQSLVDARIDARARKDFAESDRLRGEIEALGYDIKDTVEGQKVQKR
jgi:cysteinyl-tRNA synthetase